MARMSSRHSVVNCQEEAISLPQPPKIPTAVSQGLAIRVEVGVALPNSETNRRLFSGFRRSIECIACADDT